jgi:hypothetical protein
MKISLMLLGILLFALGIVFSVSIIGIALGVPLMIAGIIIFLISLIWPIRF